MAQGRFQGGDHTGQKLDALQRYLSFFTLALKNQGFRLCYIDAFAGSGAYDLASSDAGLLKGLVDDSGRATKAGSAALALATTPTFDVTILIERHQASVRQLKALAAKNPNRQIKVLSGDANEEVRRICREIPWHGRGRSGRQYRGVIFVDPFGMELSFDTLLSVANTRALDMWYLFPTNGVLRQLANDKERIDHHKEAALTRVLGGDWWEDKFYRRDLSHNDLLDDDFERAVRTVDVNLLEQSFANRLSEHFGYVSDKPRKLFQNIRGKKIQMFSLFFAVSSRNPKAIQLARRAADRILKA
ncbi:three-Cys-motif partner protein TcmP [Salinarimonas chemoclinalis]|uniref:three-Cys-motif partner protein TcmP n=1 Tax=Salinarimonas chemoclinalis TaxID=3241599 RepID=UPI0035588492